MKNGDMMDIDEIVQYLLIDLFGIVVDDDEVIKVFNYGELIVMDLKNCVFIVYCNIVCCILGELVFLQLFEE